MRTAGLLGSARALSITLRPDFPGIRRSVRIDVEGLRVHQVERLVGARGHAHVVVLRQRLLQALAGVLLVVDDEDAGGHGGHSKRRRPGGQARARRT